MIPKRSPYGLIQEDLWPDAWRILVVGIMLNQTSRKQVENVFPEFVKRWPTPAALLSADRENIKCVITPLGFGQRRTDNLIAMTERYVAGPWLYARELPGVGEYGARAWEIFCKGILGDEKPKDHALVQYWCWRTQQR